MQAGVPPKLAGYLRFTAKATQWTVQAGSGDGIFRLIANDDIHVPNAKLLPAVGMPVSICIRLKSPAHPAGGSSAKP
jgi:hypothetical protein